MSFEPNLPERYKVGVAGTGFLGKGVARMLTGFENDVTPGKVLTRRPIDSSVGVDEARLTNEIEDLVEDSDLVIECTGDVFHAAEIVAAAHAAGKPVVTMDSEFQITVGSHFLTTGFLSEAEGDQPGSLAALYEEVEAMGFEPFILGNVKGFLNHDPTIEDMQHWSRVNGISLTQVTSFTDGTKMQIEQAFVANGSGFGILKQGLEGPKDMSLDDGGRILAEEARAAGNGPVVDYVLDRNSPPGVFITGTHRFDDPEVLRYLKMGTGPFYTVVRPFHLCHLEVMKTLRRVASGGGALLTNGEKPTINVVAISKGDYPAGHKIETAIGGFEFRGEACTFESEPDAIPIGLLNGATLAQPVERGQIVNWSDVEQGDDTAWNAARSIRSTIGLG